MLSASLDLACPDERMKKLMHRLNNRLVTNDIHQPRQAYGCLRHYRPIAARRTHIHLWRMSQLLKFFCDWKGLARPSPHRDSQLFEFFLPLLSEYQLAQGKWDRLPQTIFALTTGT